MNLTHEMLLKVRKLIAVMCLKDESRRHDPLLMLLCKKSQSLIVHCVRAASLLLSVVRENNCGFIIN